MVAQRAPNLCVLDNVIYDSAIRLGTHCTFCMWKVTLWPDIVLLMQSGSLRYRIHSPTPRCFPLPPDISPNQCWILNCVPGSSPEFNWYHPSVVAAETHSLNWAKGQSCIPGTSCRIVLLCFVKVRCFIHFVALCVVVSDYNSARPRSIPYMVVEIYPFSTWTWNVPVVWYLSDVILGDGLIPC